MILSPVKPTPSFQPTSELNEGGDVNVVGAWESTKVRHSTKWRQVTTSPDGLKILALTRTMSGVYALPVIKEWADTPGKKSLSMICGCKSCLDQLGTNS